MVSDDRSKVFRIFQPLESLFFDVHDVPLQVPSVFRSKSDSVNHFDHDQLLQYLVVAMDCSHRVRLKAVKIFGYIP